jgi:type IV pilus assembly protein PilV
VQIAPPSIRAERLAAGFTLAEVLAAILVIATGLIGIAALYSDGLRTSYEASPQTHAAELAETMAKRIESNAAGRIGYLSAIGVICDPSKQPKQPDDAAAQEAACWEDEVERSLPSGLGSITRDQTTSPPTFVIAVSWSAEATGAASYVIRVQPKAP